MKVIRAYRAVFLATFQTAVQYRLQMVLWLLGNIVRPVVFLAAWAAVARAQGNNVGGFSAGDFAAYYVALTLVGQLTQSWNAYEFEQEVRLGKLSPKLLRPFHPLNYAIADNLVWKVFTLPFLLPVLALIALTFHAQFATQPWNVALFVPSVILAAGLRFTLGWVMAALAFWTTRVEAIASLFDRVGFIFAGQVAPLALLPGILQGIAYVLPFGYMLGVPADMLRGGLSIERAALLLAGQAMWFGISLLLFQVIWRAGLRQYSAVGA
jgi:ABC-2 type transport system permease protein